MTLPFFHFNRVAAFVAGPAIAPPAAVKRSVPKAAVATLPNVEADERAAAKGLAAKVIAQIRADLPQLLVVAVVDTLTGKDEASFTSQPSFDPHLAASFNAEIIKQKKRALRAFHLEDEQIEDIIISTTSHYHIIKAINNGQKFIYVAVLEHTTSLGFVREVLRRHSLSLVA